VRLPLSTLSLNVRFPPIPDISVVSAFDPFLPLRTMAAA